MTAPAEHPILFTGPMVRAILEGRKTQTRRIMKPQPRLGLRGDGTPVGGDYHVWEHRGQVIPLTDSCAYRWGALCPYGQPGDFLWVRETWRRSPLDFPDGIQYRADSLLRWFDGSTLAQTDRTLALGLPRDGRWRSSRFMPKWACRLWLRVEDVRVERLQEIRCGDIRAEGFGCPEHDFESGFCASECRSLRREFEDAWDGLNRKRAPWESNPWVWAITFSRTDAPGSEVER